MSGKQIVGVILFVIGVTTLLGLVGIHVGGLLSFVLGIIMIVYGMKKWNEQRQVLGAILFVFGGLLLIGSVPVIFTILVGALLVYFGIKMVRNKHTGSSPETDPSPRPTKPDASLQDPFDEEWERLMKSAKT